ncbi:MULTISPECIES: SecDF P1 head subdomain-containing protein [unclassified Saccharothrix]|uniref:SecDF P1 head subdomain-containing protein n=1 Tax=unclassified Saccharothrix TaxID=2593673 RepID=UPI00307E574A
MPTTSPAPPPGAVLHFRPVLAVSTPITPTSTTGVPRKAEPDTAAVAQARRARQDPALASGGVAELSCPAEDPLAGRDDPALPLLTCGRDGSVYLLGPAELDRSHVEHAEARGDVVDVRFTIPGGVRWAEFTGRLVGQRVAIVVNTLVLSAPTVQEAITGGGAEISGQFSESEAGELAARITGG